MSAERYDAGSRNLNLKVFELIAIEFALKRDIESMEYSVHTFPTMPGSKLMKTNLADAKNALDSIKKALAK